MEERARFAGHRLITFSSATRSTLAEIGTRLTPHLDAILGTWITQQFQSWEPPSFTHESLGKLFEDLLGGILRCMRSGDLESCIDGLEQAGSNLAAMQFPFDALIISIHFLERSYMPFLLTPPPAQPRKWLVTMDEFLHVALAALANAYFESYRKELLERAEVGRIVQESLMPEIPKAIADLEIGHIYISAHEQAQLGGDFLDAFTSHTGESIFLIGDLSGHGLEAAAGSVMLRSIFRSFVREHSELGEAMQRLDHVLSSELGASQFATALAISYRDGGQMKLVNAGHPYPVLCDTECRLIDIHGSALAIGESAAYQMVELDLKPGAVLVAYTDGVTEAGRRRDMFGDERLLGVVSTMKDAPARAIVDQLVDDAHRHAGGKFTDDVAVLVLKRKRG